MTRDQEQRTPKLRGRLQAANLEEGLQSRAEAVANDDDQLVRFEFIEVLVRIAFSKYIASGLMRDASDAVARLLEECVLPRAPPAALVDPNAFRFGRMYCAEVEAVLERHWDFLGAVFKVRDGGHAAVCNAQSWRAVKSLGAVALNPLGGVALQ